MGSMVKQVLKHFFVVAIHVEEWQGLAIRCESVVFGGCVLKKMNYLQDLKIYFVRLNRMN